jgi:hypothetical protein
VMAPGKQFEGTAAVRIGTAIVVSGQHRCTSHDYRPGPPRAATGRDLSQGTSRRRLVTNRPKPHLPPGSVPADRQSVKESPGGEAGARRTGKRPEGL